MSSCFCAEDPVDHRLLAVSDQLLQGVDVNERFRSSDSDHNTGLTAWCHYCFFMYPWQAWRGLDSLMTQLVEGSAPCDNPLYITHV